MRRIVQISLFAALGLFLLQAPLAQAAFQPSVEIQPRELDIDTFFSGADVVFTGEIPAAQDVVIEVAGPQENGVFDVKGRWGPFWMNREQVSLDNLPVLYAVLLPSGKDWIDALPSLDLGFERLKSDLRNGPSDLETGDLFDMFVKLKESEGLYSEVPGAVTYSNESSGRKKFTARFHFPPATTPGEFVITAIPIAEKAKGSSVSRTLKVEETGFVKMVHDLAFTNGLAYGTISVIIALITGTIMGILFKRGGGGH